MAIIAFVQAALTANGGTTGILTVASTTGFVAGAKVWLYSSAVDGIELVVDAVVDATHLAVRKPNLWSRFNASSYTTAQTATVTQNKQDDNLPNWRQ